METILPSTDSIADALDAQQEASAAINDIGMGVTVTRAPYKDEDGDLVDEASFTLRCIQLPSREEKIHNSEDMSGFNMDNPDLMQWGFDYQADIREGDVIVFGLQSDIEYKITKVTVPQGLADIVILRVMECDRVNKTPVVEN